MTVEQRLKEEFVRRAVEEDLGRGDLFARISESKEISAVIVAKSEGVFAGREYIDVFGELYPLKLEWMREDGESFAPGDRLLVLWGDARDLLALERSILDMALHASGIATLTARYVAAMEGTECVLLDTRKTRPGLRAFEKYAVRCGGGQNHRMGLDDCLMLKDTHLRAIEDLEGFMKRVRRQIPFTAKIEIECEDLEMSRRAMEAGADIVMCDNMTPEQIREVVALRNEHFPHVLLEASGNITLKTIRSVAETGVDAVSSGSIIHQAVWPDLSMKVGM
ncbi:carboxylating nicotinate-nucleotide diphosphorylase [Nitratifractor salsuginis]|uniref:nicotinate-nucleotide diphosphorylase (carboxylating) n=1 Tax=Nitratifractor salsuginis (strain DSM 16511 / JCM 12458 / E9I37-1) TaxID=749222 RepID=E6X2E3_NITSE|nr:carboxylating nicotinate-nucleotide diphosphorylase [Nitratifractor salsuginis]ADV47148.1 nicotinate-nucleotide pyrophosphorylase (carboxylating) [Nitratifractor salsuginis DSM 16511]